MNLPALRTLAKHLPTYQIGNLGALRVYDAATAKYAYSILGVMTDIYRRATKQGNWVDQEGRASRFIILPGEPWVIEIPPIVTEWFGLDTMQVNNLWLLQADGYDFKQIAKAIEKMIERKRG